MKEDILNNGLDNYERKLDNKAGIFFALTVILSLSVIVLLATVSIKQREINAKNHQLKQREILINSLTATNNELLHDNLNLSNGK